MNESETGTETQVDWSLKGKMIEIISNQLSKATSSYTYGDERPAYFAMKAIRMLIEPYLNETEVSYFLEAEKVLGSYYSLKSELKAHAMAQQKVIPIIKEAEMVKRAKQMLLLRKETTYEFYHSAVMNALKKYGFLFAVKQDDTDL